MSLQAPASGAFEPVRSLLVALDANGLHAFGMLTSAWHDIAIGGDAAPANAQLVWDDAGQRLLAVADGVFACALDANATTATFTQLATTNAPPPRTAFALAVSGTTLWLSGGVTASGCTFDDLWTLDLDSLAWSNVWPATSCQ